MREKVQRWRLDFQRFRSYLRKKYGVAKAYLFLGYLEENKKLYQDVSGVTILKVLKASRLAELTGRITEDLMLKAFKAVKKNRGAAGIDKVSIKMFEQNRDENLRALPALPQARDERPQGRFLLAVSASAKVYFEPHFSPFSFGFRPGRNCHRAVYKVVAFRKLGYIVVLDADIQSFFDSRLRAQTRVADGKRSMTVLQATKLDECRAAIAAIECEKRKVQQPYQKQFSRLKRCEREWLHHLRRNCHDRARGR